MQRRYLCVVLLTGWATGALAGPLDPPPGPIASTAPIEARTPIALSTTPGDADSVYKITQPGSYYLVGEVVGAAGRMGIEVGAVGAVTIDLNGFTVRGVPGALGGIVITPGAAVVHVSNGVVSDWPQWGIQGVTAAQGVKVASNAGGGISAVAGATVANCVVVGSGSAGEYGVRTGANSGVFDCVVSNNGGSTGGGGVFIGAGSQVRRCVVSTNATAAVGGAQGYGILVLADSVVADCRVDGNGSAAASTGGIRAPIGTSVTGCSVQSNLNVGIQCEGEGLISGNNVSGTLGVGIFCLSGSNQLILGNHVCVNSVGIRVTGAGNTIARNTMRSNDVPLDIGSGNDVGPLGTAASSTNPWANIGN